MISLDAIPDPPGRRCRPIGIRAWRQDMLARGRTGLSRATETTTSPRDVHGTVYRQMCGFDANSQGPGRHLGTRRRGWLLYSSTGSALPHPCALSCTIRDRRRAQSSAPAARHDMLARSRGLLDQHRALGTRLDDCRLVLDRARGHVETDLRSGCAHLWYRPGRIGQAQSRNRQWPAVEEVVRERGRGSGIEGG